MIKIYVCGQNVSGEYSPVASDSINYLEACFSFSPDWYGLEKTAQFTQNGKTYNVLLEKNKCLLPSELCEGFADISVFGQSADTARRITTLPFSMVIKKSAFVSDGDTPIPPTPDLYSQLLGRVNDAISDIPKKLSEFENDPGFITAKDIPEAEIPDKLSQLENDAGFITSDDVPEAPAKLSQLENDTGFITAKDVPEVKVPTKLSQFENDAGYIAPDKNNQINIAAATVDVTGGSVTIGQGTNYLSMANNIVHGVTTPEENNDAATKGYVDGLVGAAETALDSIIAIQTSLIGGDA